MEGQTSHTPVFKAIIKYLFVVPVLVGNIGCGDVPPDEVRAGIVCTREILKLHSRIFSGP